MTPGGERYVFLERESGLGESGLAPLLPLALSVRNTVRVVGLLDTGATVNVLPYEVGRQLGGVWEQQSTKVTLGGNLAALEARGLVVTARVGKFPPIRLVFAWTRSDAVPVLLGQVNFFMEFDVCFFRSRSEFEIRPQIAT